MALVLCIWSATVFIRNTHHVNSKSLNLISSIYYHNINSSNKSYEDLGKNIISKNADIVALVEVNPLADKKLEQSLKNYSFHFSLPREDNYGFSIFSKNKIIIEEVYEDDGIPLFIKFSNEKNNLTFYLIHLPPPLWTEAFKIQKNVISILNKEILNKKPILVFGDLNMSQYSNILKTINTNLIPNGNLLNGTWPVLLPAFFRINLDHVFSNQQTNIDDGDFAGSDHRALMIKFLEQAPADLHDAKSAGDI